MGKGQGKDGKRSRIPGRKTQPKQHERDPEQGWRDLQDNILFCAERGHSLDWLLGLTLDQFYSTYHSCERLQATEMMLNSNMLRAAASTQQDFEKWLKFWKKRLSSGVPKKSDLSSFLEDFGKGF